MGAKPLKPFAKDNRLVSVDGYDSSFVYNMEQHYKLLVSVFFRVYGVYNLTNLINVSVSFLSPEIWLANCFSKRTYDWLMAETRSLDGVGWGEVRLAFILRKDYCDDPGSPCLSAISIVC